MVDSSFAQSTCDANRACSGNALRFDGSDFQYVDVFNTPILQSIDSTKALTVELWLKISRRANVKQYIAGVWGPRTDRDDQWVLYVDEQDSLIFELSNGATSFGGFDNTRIAISIAAQYGSWFHLAGMWDGISQQARLYVDGQLVGQAINAQYPIASLRRTQSYLQLASFNGITNDPATQKTMLGEIDEFRLWNRTIAEDQLRCNRFASLNGNEAGLILYFRCNDPSGTIALCDASRYNWRGAVRGGADFYAATRTVPQTIFTSPPSFTFPLGCISDTSFAITVRDTSICGSTVDISITGNDAPAFQLSTTRVTLQQNIPQTISIASHLRTTGNISASINLVPQNRCQLPAIIPISIMRNTQLQSSFSRLTFDTLYGCANKPQSDTTIRLCNNSGDTLTITDIRTQFPQFTAAPIGWTFPLRLLPGECRDARVTFFTIDSGLYRDTLRIISTDKCPGSGLIPITGRFIKVLHATIDSINFDQPNLPCKRSLNLAQEFFVRNLTTDSLFIEAFESTLLSFSSPTRVPFYLIPNRSYQAYIRFRENVEGFYRDTVRIRMRFKGCTIYRPVIVQGRIIDVKLAPSDTLVDFGNVTVGRTATRTISVRNLGIDRRQVFCYLQSGRVFTIAPQAPQLISAGDSGRITITFRPLEARMYRDTLCIQDVGCFITKCIIIQGNGVDGALSFLPGYIEAGNVINCRCRVDTMRVTNTSTAPITISSAAIQGSTNFTFLAPLPSANEILQPNQTRIYVVQFCPNGAPDTQTDVAEIVLQNDGPDGALRILLRGTNIQPKLFIEPVTSYGDVEVGTSLVLPIKIQNVSPTDVRVDSIGFLPPGFTLVNTAPPLPITLAYRDTMLAFVRFSPPSNTTYNGGLKMYSNQPCAISAQGLLTGKGIIVPLFVPWTTIVFREATRCDSVPREVAFINDGSVPIRIDSIWFTGVDTAAFTWKGATFTGIPRDVPPHTNDTIRIFYFPKLGQNVQSIAQIHIAATNRLGQEVFTINLIGGRIQQFIPNTNRILFPPTPVRLSAPNRTLSLTNPSYLDTLIVDSLSFEPAQGVFGVIGQLPRVIPPRATASFQITFTPRAAVDYAAHFRMRNRQPCNEVDTTISIFGQGYTPPYLVRICIDTTISAKIGDRIRIPVMLNRNIPQNPVDISFFVSYYTKALKFEGVEPVFTTQSLTFDTLRQDGIRISLKTNQNVGAGPIAWLNFRVAVADSVSFFFVTDSVDFASDSTLFIALLGDGCPSTITLNPNCNITRLNFNANHYRLSQNRPNPFGASTQSGSTSTIIDFEIMEDVPVILRVLDARGREVARLLDSPMMHGAYQVTFSADKYSSGVYYYEMRAGVFTEVKRMVVVK